MAREDSDGLASNTASQAMNKVLEAEQVANKQIAECKRAALKTVQDAQRHAALIAQRTNERITMQHLRCKQEIAQQIAAMERTAASEVKELHADKMDAQLLSRVVSEVAAALTDKRETEPER